MKSVLFFCAAVLVMLGYLSFQAYIALAEIMAHVAAKLH